MGMILGTFNVAILGVGEMRDLINPRRNLIRRIHLKPTFATFLASEFSGGGCEGGVCKEHPAQAMLGVPITIQPDLKESFLIEYVDGTFGRGDP